MNVSFPKTERRGRATFARRARCVSPYKYPLPLDGQAIRLLDEVFASICQALQKSAGQGERGQRAGARGRARSVESVALTEQRRQSTKTRSRSIWIGLKSATRLSSHSGQVVEVGSRHRCRTASRHGKSLHPIGRRSRSRLPGPPDSSDRGQAGSRAAVSCHKPCKRPCPGHREMKPTPWLGKWWVTYCSPTRAGRLR